MAGPAECAGRAEALELASSQMFVQHASSPEGAAESVDVRQRRETAAPPFGSWSAWIGLVIGAIRCMAIIPVGSGISNLWQVLALADFYFSRRLCGNT